MVKPTKQQAGRKSPSRSPSPTVVEILTLIQKLNETNDLLDGKVGEDDVIMEKIKKFKTENKKLAGKLKALGGKKSEEIETLTDKVRKLRRENEMLVENNEELEAANQRLEEKLAETKQDFFEMVSEIQNCLANNVLPTLRLQSPSIRASKKDVSNYFDDDNSSNSEEWSEKRPRSSSRDSVETDDEECQPSTSSGWTGKN